MHTLHFTPKLRDSIELHLVEMSVQADLVKSTLAHNEAEEKEDGDDVNFKKCLTNLYAVMCIINKRFWLKYFILHKKIRSFFLFLNVKHDFFFACIYFQSYYNIKSELKHENLVRTYSTSSVKGCIEKWSQVDLMRSES